MASISFGLERIATLAPSHVNLSLGILICLTIVALAGANRITFQDDLRQIFQGDSQAYASYLEFNRRFPGTGEQIYILVQGVDLSDAEDVASLVGLHLDFVLIEEITSVLSPAALRRYEGEALQLIVDGKNSLGIDDVREIRGHPFLGPLLIDRHASSIGFIVQMAPASLQKAKPKA